MITADKTVVIASFLVSLLAHDNRYENNAKILK